MRVNIEFDRPFYGMIFSKGHYSDQHCVHLKPGTGHLSATFEIFLNSCGMSSSANHNAQQYGAPTPSGSYVENTIIIQYDPYVQEVWDQVICVFFLPFSLKLINLLHTGSQAAMHMVRLLRESSDIPTIPSGYAARRYSQFLGRQSSMLDANSSGKRSVGVRSVWHR